jgi:hypothetical protein
LRLCSPDKVPPERKGDYSYEAELSFSVTRPVHTNCKVHAPAQPAVTSGGQPVAVEWNPQSRIAWFDAAIKPGSRVAVTVG